MLQLTHNEQLISESKSKKKNCLKNLPPNICSLWSTLESRTLKSCLLLQYLEIAEHSTWILLSPLFFIVSYICFQIQGESLASSSAALGNRAVGYLPKANYKGVLGTICTITRHEGPRALYNGIVPGLQRQMVFASIRIGFYDNVKGFYQQQLGG